MSGFIVYLLSTGGIDRTGSVPDGDELVQGGAGEGVLLNDDPSVSGSTHWVNLGPPATLVAKTAMGTSIDRTYIAAGLSQVATISGVPQGAEFFVNSVDKGRVDDGVVTFSAAAIGRYALSLTHYRYLEQDYTVDVGIAQLTAATETEYAVNLRSPLTVASETEVALSAGQERTSQLAVASETETAVAAGMVILVNVDLASETESAVDASAPLPAAQETETAFNAVLSTIIQLPEASETETALDVAA
jgi:hypothetical protein